MEFWNRFRSTAEHQIVDGNAEAGERLWEVVPSSDTGTALTIRSTRWDGDAVECAFDASTGALTCAPGPAIHAPTLVFHVLPDGRVRRGGVDCTMDEAVNLVLGELVWVDDLEATES